MTEFGTNLLLTGIAIGADGNPWTIARTNNTYSGQSGTATFSGGSFHFFPGPSDGGDTVGPITTAPTGVYAVREFVVAGDQYSEALSLVNSAGSTTNGPGLIAGPAGNNVAAAYDSASGLFWAGVSNANVFAGALLAANAGSIVVNDRFNSILGPGPIAVDPSAVYGFFDADHPYIARYSKTGALLRTFSVPNGIHPTAMIAGPNAAIWFTDDVNNAVGDFTRTGHFVEYPLPSSNARPSSIAVSAGDNVWFVEYNARKIGRVRNGHVTEYSLPPGGQSAVDITSSGSQAKTLWFDIVDGPGSYRSGIGEISLGRVVCALSPKAN